MEPELEMSPLSQTIVHDGFELRVEIYRPTHSDWAVKVYDHELNMTLWGTNCKTDAAALKLVFDVIKEEGIGALVVPMPGSSTPR